MNADPSSWNVIVTGGASGLGAAVASRLDHLGATTIVLDRQTPGPGLAYVQVDLADSKDTEEAVRQAADEHGGDAVVTCAGIDVPGPLLSTPAETWERIVAVNLFGTVAVIRAALPYLLESGGRIVTVASTLGHTAVSDASAYCASKFGVVGFSRVLMAELKGQVGVTMLTPGGMGTAFFDGRDEQYRPGPDAQLSDPADVAAAVMFALSQPPGCEVKEMVVAGPTETSWP